MSNSIALTVKRFVLTAQNFRSYWKPILLLATGAALYAFAAADAESLRAKVDLAPKPSVDLFAQALANLGARLAGLVLVIWGALWASRKTWVAGALCFVLAGIAPVPSGWHWGALVLGLVSLVFTWYEVHEGDVRQQEISIDERNDYLDRT